MRHQLRQLSGDTAVYGVTTIIQRFLSFLLTPFYTHFLLRSELGIQANIFVIIAFLLVLANAGMEAAYFKFDSIATDEKERRAVYWNGLAINWVMAVAIGMGIVLFPEFFNRITLLNVGEKYIHLIRMAGVIIFLDSAAMVTLGLLRMRRKAKVFGGIKIAAITVNIGLNIWLVAFEGMKLEGVFIAGIVQSAVQLGLTLPFLFGMFPIRFSKDLRKQMVRFGLPTIGSGVAMIALQLVDRPIMQRLAGFDALGLYQANYRLGIVMVVFVSMFEFAWKPFFLQQAAAENARRLFARVFTYFNLVAAFLFLSVSFYIANIAALPIPFRSDVTFVAESYWEGLVIVPIVLGAYLLNGWYANFVAGALIEKKTKALAWIAGLGAVSEAIFCFLLIPSFGIAGGAWATLIAYAVMAAAMYLYIRQWYAVEYEWGRVAKIMAGAGMLWVANMFFLDFYDTSLSAGLLRFGLLLLFPVWLLVVRFAKPEERREASRLFARFGGEG